MKIPADTKLDIQCFVYFLFKGTMDPRLIAADFDYLDKLLANKDLLYNCFEVFAYASQNGNTERPDETVATYILALHGKMSKESLSIIEVARKSNQECITYWKDFLILANWFCHNSFPDPLSKDYIKDLHGIGCDAVPPFAVWTNVVDLDGDLKVINSEKALRRANERIKWSEKDPSIGFEDWEVDQEIY